VSTVIQSLAVFPYPRGLTFNEHDSAYITSVWHGLLHLDLRSDSVTKLTNGPGPVGSLSATELSQPSEITFLSPSVLLITVRDQLLLVNIKKNAITQICGGMKETRDGDIRSCQLDRPNSILVVNQSVYVGQNGAIRRIPLEAFNKFMQPWESTTAISGRSS